MITHRAATLAYKHTSNEGVGTRVRDWKLWVQAVLCGVVEDVLSEGPLRCNHTHHGNIQALSGGKWAVSVACRGLLDICEEPIQNIAPGVPVSGLLKAWCLVVILLRLRFSLGACAA